MTNAIDGIRAKFQFTLIQTEKAKEREMVARRKTNVAIERTKAAEKKTYYLTHKCVALKDRLFIYGLKLERTLLKLVAARKRIVFNKDCSSYVDQHQFIYTEETWEEKITMLEVLELEYNGDTAVLDAKKEMVLKRLGKLDERISITNEEKKILENRLVRASETLRLKEMKLDFDNNRRTSRSHILGQLKVYLQMANERYRTAIDEIDRLTRTSRSIAENLVAQNNATREIKRELQRVIRLKRESVGEMRGKN